MDRNEAEQKSFMQLAARVPFDQARDALINHALDAHFQSNSSIKRTESPDTSGRFEIDTTIINVPKTQFVRANWTTPLPTAEAIVSNDEAGHDISRVYDFHTHPQVLGLETPMGQTFRVAGKKEVDIGYPSADDPNKLTSTNFIAFNKGLGAVCSSGPEPTHAPGDEPGHAPGEISRHIAAFFESEQSAISKDKTVTAYKFWSAANQQPLGTLRVTTELDADASKAKVDVELLKLDEKFPELGGLAKSKCVD